MIELAKTSVTILAPVKTVFVYATNMEHYKQWFPGVLEIHSANNLKHGEVGKTYVEQLALPNGETALEIKVVQCEENRLFITQGDLVGLLPQMEMTFTSQGESSCTMDLSYSSRNPALSENTDMLETLRANLHERAETGIAKLKSILETS